MPRQDRFLTENQMERMRDLALLGMITPVTIERRAEGPVPPDGDYGDDFLQYTVTAETRRQTVNGWFYSTPTPVQDVDTGQIVTVNTYRLFLPVGTDIKVGDHVHVGNADPRDDYTVSDTTAESTWLPLLTCSLRKKE
jgi:hypothetical protein